MDSPFFAVLAILITVYFAYKIFAGFNAKPKICTSCGTVGEGRTITRGSVGIEIILWLCFILPGLIYSVWRHTSQYTGCEVCGSKDMIPLDSPVGRRIVYQNSKQVPA
jgi:hypothetical protein